jgi:hypothetical protein
VRRREAIAALLSLGAARTGAVDAQSSTRTYRVGFFLAGGEDGIGL